MAGEDIISSEAPALHFTQATEPPGTGPYDNLPTLTPEQRLDALEGQIGDIRFSFDGGDTWHAATHQTFGTPTWSKLDHRCFEGVDAYTDAVLAQAQQEGATSIIVEMHNSIYDVERGQLLPPEFTDRSFTMDLSGGYEDFGRLSDAIRRDMDELLEIQGRFHLSIGEELSLDPPYGLPGPWEHRNECLVS